MKTWIKNVWAYIQGNVRHKLYYGSIFYIKLAFLIPVHIREQIEHRISIMDKECYMLGQCKLCGCDTPNLQMANKQCDKPCYPKMMNKKVWEAYKKVGI